MSNLRIRRLSGRGSLQLLAGPIQMGKDSKERYYKCNLESAVNITTVKVLDLCLSIM